MGTCRDVHAILPVELGVSSVIKVGGSLLGMPDLPARLIHLLADFTRPRPLLLPGGGACVDSIRHWDRVYALGEETSHWIALEALAVTARLMAAILPGGEVVTSPEAMSGAWRRGKIPVYDPLRFVTEIDEHQPEPLPRRWRVTSDSLAARMARVFGAPEVVLLKSTTFPPDMTIERAAKEGLVDPHFPTAARDLPRVAAVNLREEEPREVVLLPEDGWGTCPR